MIKSPQLDDINEQIGRSLDSGRYSEAIARLHAMAEAVNAPWNIKADIRRLKDSYGYLRKYALEGVDDPTRLSMLASIVADVRALGAMIVRQSMIDESPRQYFATLRYEKLQPDSVLSAIIRAFREVSDKLSLASLTYDPVSLKRRESLAHEQSRVANRLFNYVWTLYPLTQDDVAELDGFLRDGNIRTELRSQLLGAVFLGALEYFDEKRLTLMAGIYHAGVPGLEVRALVGLVITMWMQRKYLHGSSYTDVLATLKEKPGWREDVKMVFLNLVRTRDTDRISRTMKDELIPGMMKLRPEIFKKFSEKDNPEEIDPEGFNPEWEEMLQKSGIADKLRELNDMQSEGSDVMLSTFAGLKSFPFFNDAANWFLPFFTDQVDAARALGDSADDLGEMLALVPMLCDSDKYSMTFSLERLPSVNRRMMLEQFRQQNINVAELRNTMLNPENVSRNNEANHFIHDLYRFHTLYRRKGEFPNPFKAPVNLAALPQLADDLEDTMALEAVGEFYFKRGYHAEAADIFGLLLRRNAPSAPLLQKAGYCARQLGRLEDAVDLYRKSELLAPDNTWTMRQLAQVLRQLGHHQEALPYYERLVAMKPTDLSLALNLGHCYLALNRYDEAMKCYYKVEYLDADGTRALRPIAWCAFVMNDFDRSRKYYDRVLASDPTPSDYLNYAHLAMATKRYREASDAYRRFLQLNAGDIDKLHSAICADNEYLSSAGIDGTMLDLVVDAVQFPDDNPSL